MKDLYKFYKNSAKRKAALAEAAAAAFAEGQRPIAPAAPIQQCTSQQGEKAMADFECTMNESVEKGIDFYVFTVLIIFRQRDLKEASQFMTQKVECDTMVRSRGMFGCLMRRILIYLGSPSDRDV